MTAAAIIVDSISLAQNTHTFKSSGKQTVCKMVTYYGEVHDFEDPDS